MQNAKPSGSALLFLACAAVAAAPSVLRPGRVSASQRTAAQAKPPQLTVTPTAAIWSADGQPFLYLSDTAWELFHRPNREQVRAYLELRAKQKFTVIHAVALAEVEGISVPNAYGDLPLIDKDPTRPAVTPGSNPKNAGEYDYWDNVDYVVDEINRLGMYVAFLPTWGRWLGVNQPRDERIITAQNAQAYGEFLGKRYGKKSIIWVLGGDRTGQALRGRVARHGQGHRHRHLRA